MGLAVYNYILTPFLTFQPWPALGYSFLPDPSFPARACDYAGFAHAIEKAQTRPWTKEPFHPDRTFAFPKKRFGAREQSCQARWFEDYPFLHYI